MVLLSLLLSLAASVATVIAAEDPRPQGFAYADGENFAVDGEKFYFFGTNAYWFAFLDVGSSLSHVLIFTNAMLQNITDVSVAMDKAKVGTGTIFIQLSGLTPFSIGRRNQSCPNMGIPRPQYHICHWWASSVWQ